MAAPRQLAVQLQVLSRIFLPQKSLHCSLVARSCECRLLYMSQKYLVPIRRTYTSEQKDISAKSFCTENHATQRDVSETERATTSDISAGPDSTSQDYSPQETGIHRHGSKAKNTLQRPSSGRAGDIKVGNESLYDLVADPELTQNAQQQQQEDKEFYRRRMESEWGPGQKETFRGYQEFDPYSDPPPVLKEHIHEPVYYAAGLLCCCIFMAFALFTKEKKETVELLIAKSWVADREGNLAEAEALLHKALKMAQDEKNMSGVTYIFDQMANLAMRHGNLTKAEGLFKETLKLMISSGTAQDDSAVIEISLKLARMFDKMRRYDDAEQGFKWCITTTEKKLTESSDKETTRNLQSLLGMCLDCYARFLAAHGRLQEAKDAYERALAICEIELQVDGVSHPQTVVLLNDLGTVYDLGGNYKEAIEIIERAADLAEKRSPHDLPTVLCNLASVKMHAGQFEEARTHYKRALSLAEKQGDAAAILEIKNSMAQLETNIFLKGRKEHRQDEKKEAQKKS